MGVCLSPDFRLKMKPDVVLRRLAIAVASNDHSYMPQLVSVAIGKNRRSLEEIKDIRIPSNVTGYVSLLENADITYQCESQLLSLLHFMGFDEKKKESNATLKPQMCKSISRGA